MSTPPDQHEPPLSPAAVTAGRGIGVAMTGVFGLGALISGLFTVAGVVGPLLGPSADEYPASVPGPEQGLSVLDFIGPAIVLALFGPMTVVLARACYAGLRSALGKPPIRVITPGLGWMIAIVFGGSTLAACGFGAATGQWGLVVSALSVLPLFAGAPFVTKLLHGRHAAR